MDVKKLGVVVEQKGIAPTAKNLERLAKASESAQQPLERLSSTLGGFKTVNLDSFSSKLQDTTQAIKDVKASTSGLAEMAKNITGLSVNLTNIANATDRLSAKTADVAAYVTQLKAMRVELEGMKGLSANVGRTSTGGSGRTSGGNTGGSPSSVDATATNALTAAQQRLMTQLERTALMVGKTKSEYLAARAAQQGLTEVATPYIAKIAEAEKATTKFTMSAKHMNATMRMVPAQFTDIVTQLAGGQNPLLILTQQGGQLRDMFGGLGAMLRAVGPMVLKFLTNPFVLAAAAIGAVAYSFYSNISQLMEFNKAMNASNNITGVATSQFYAMRDSVSAVAKSSGGEAADALTALAKSGKFTSDNIEGVAVSIVKMSKATGIAVDQLVTDFASLREKPTEAAIKLTEKYHYLTVETYKLSKELENQGRVEEAVALQTKALEDAIAKLADNSVEKMGYLERSVKSVAKVFKDFAAGVMSIGADDPAKTLASINKQIDYLQKTLSSSSDISIMGTSREDLENTLSALQKQKNSIESVTKAEQAAAKASAEQQRSQEDQIKGQEGLRKMAEQYSKTTAKQRELTEASVEYAKAISGSTDSASALQAAETYAKVKAGIEEKYADKSGEKAQRRLDNAEREKNAILGTIEALRMETAAMEENGLAYQKTNQHIINAAKWRAQAADTKVSKPEKARALELAALEEIAAYEKEINTQKLANTKAAEAYNNTVAKNKQEVSDLAALYAQEQKYITMTAKEKAAAQALYANEVEMNKQLLTLKEKLNKVEKDSAEAGYIKAQIADTEKAYTTKGTLIKENLALQEKELSWSENLSVASRRYTEDLGTHNSVVQSSFISMFGTVESALEGFVSGTKFSFKDLATSVLKSLAVMFAKIALMKVAMAGIGLLGIGRTTPTSTGNTTPGFSGSDLGGGIKMNAKGNAFTSTGIAKFAQGGTFTNGVVSRPTPFKFASGGAFSNGVMGEAGPEAVVPLTRMSDGNLGVQSSGGSGQQNNVSVNIVMNGDGSSNSTTTSDDKASAKAMGELIARKVKEVITEQQRPGGLLATR